MQRVSPECKPTMKRKYFSCLCNRNIYYRIIHVHEIVIIIIIIIIIII
jgi:hypothetical protein